MAITNLFAYEEFGFECFFFFYFNGGFLPYTILLENHLALWL